MNKIQFDKLPKYAQEEISRLRSRETELQHTIDGFNGDKDSPVNLLTSGLNEVRPLPNYPVRFFLGDKHVDIRVDGDHLDVNASWCLQVSPISSNLVHLRVS